MPPTDSPAGQSRCSLLLALCRNGLYFLWAYGLLPYVAVRLKIRGYRKTLAWSHRAYRPRAALPQKQAVLHAKSMSDMISAASRYGPYQASCLWRSLVLVRMMARAGIRGELVLAAKPVGQQLKAHAWVQLGDIVINDQPDIAEEFTSFGSHIG